MLPNEPMYQSEYTDDSFLNRAIDYVKEVVGTAISAMTWSGEAGDMSGWDSRLPPNSQNTIDEVVQRNVPRTERE